jgi:hypothetical protein
MALPSEAEMYRLESASQNPMRSLDERARHAAEPAQHRDDERFQNELAADERLTRRRA